MSDRDGMWGIDFELDWNETAKLIALQIFAASFIHKIAVLS